MEKLSSGWKAYGRIRLAFRCYFCILHGHFDVVVVVLTLRGQASHSRARGAR